MTVERKRSLIERMREGYEKAKKPIAYLVMLLAVALETLPDELFPADVREPALTGVLIVLALILMEILFEIYDRIVKERRSLNLLNSNELYREIRQIVAREREVHIQYIGVAGRHGWQNVLDKLLHEHEPDSLIAKVRFRIEIALLDPELCRPDHPVFGRFEMAGPIARQIRRRADAVAAMPNPSSVDLYFYRHMPNLLGFLINGNYLFLTNTFFEWRQDELVLRAGGSEYFVYDKNDEFGGQEVIKRFAGWFEFIRQQAPEAADGQSPDARSSDAGDEM